MARVPDIQAQPLPGGDRIDVLRFDHDHERIRLGPHRHRDLELMYIERGSGTHRLGHHTGDVGTGDVLLLTPGLVHDATSLTGVTGWAVEFDPLALGLTRTTEQVAAPSLTLSRTWWSNPLLAPFLRAEQQPTSARFTIPEHARPIWAAHLRIMHRERTELRDGYREMVAAYLRIILVALSRVAADYTGTLQHSGESTLADVFGVIEQRYTRPLSTSDVAATIGLTPGYLTTLVRRQTGRTVGEWITERRMAAARDLLTSTDLTAEQISARVGYTDPAYFSRKFRQVHGTSLRAWRSEARAERR
jgi:AraC family transcriptional regulator, transcriptional activator of pobA